MKIIQGLIKCSTKREKVKKKINSVAPSSLTSSQIAYAERKAAQLERSYCFLSGSGLELVIDTNNMSAKIVY